MFPIVFWNIFALLFANRFLASLYFIYIIVLFFIFADGFSVILRNISASLYFVVTRYRSAAFSLARDAFFYATFSCVVARFIFNIHAIAFTCWLVAARLLYRGATCAIVGCVISKGCLCKSHAKEKSA
jgi:hypothetical protein